MLNDCWPAASGWALIDYYTYPKAAYYSFKRCAKDIITSIDREDRKVKIYLCNDSLGNASVEVCISVLDYKTNQLKTLRKYEIDCPGEKSFAADEISVDELKENELLLCEIKNEKVTDRAFYKQGKLEIKPVEAVEIVQEGNGFIVLKAKEYVHVVQLEGECEFEDNYFSLLPEEERVIQCMGNVKDISVNAFSL